MKPKPGVVYEFGAFRLDPSEQQLLHHGQTLSLSPRVLNVLTVLVERAGHLVDKQTLLNEVWSDAFVEESNINRAISVLRKALDEDNSVRYIETVPKRGYRFVAPVTTTNGTSSESVRRHARPFATGRQVAVAA